MSNTGYKLIPKAFLIQWTLVMNLNELEML
jgi:hypothetical protein